MELIEINWNHFFISVPAMRGEKDEDYLKRTQSILASFYEKNTSTSIDIRKISRHPVRDIRLEALTEEMNFCDMHLADVNYCDVKYAVNAPESCCSRNGIDIWSHSDRPEWRKPMLDFLRQKWKEFNYTAD